MNVSIRCGFVLLVVLTFSSALGQHWWLDISIREGDSYTEIIAKAKAYFAEKGIDEGFAYKEFLRWRRAAFAQSDVDGRMPGAAAHKKAFEVYRSMRERQEKTEVGGPVWESVVPEKEGFIGRMGNQTQIGKGRINCIRYDPNDADTVYIGSAGGGVWGSSDGGKQWRPLTDDAPIPSMQIIDIAVHPNGRDIYALANGATTVPDSGAFAGSLLHSSDAGASWRAEDVSMCAPSGKAGATAHWTRLILDPERNTLYLSALGLQSGGVNYGGGVYVKTASGDWRCQSAGVQAYDMEIVTVDEKTYLYQVWYDPGKQLTSFSTTIMQDGKQPKTTIHTFGSGIKGGQVTVTDSGQVYIMLLNTSQQVMGLQYCATPASPPEEVPNATLPEKNGNPIKPRNNSFNVVPANPKILYIGAAVLCRSTNGGVTWVNLTQQPDFKMLHADHNDVSFPPGVGDGGAVCLVANDAGVYRIDKEKNGDRLTFLKQGLEAVQIYTLATDDTGEVISIGTQDNGSFIYDGDWRRKVGAGDGARSLVDRNNNEVVYWSVLTSPQTLFRSTNRGRQGNKNQIFQGGGSGVLAASIDLENTNRLYAANTDFWILADVSENNNWQKVDAGFGGAINALAQSPANLEIFYASHGGTFYHGTSRGLEWQSQGYVGFGTNVVDLTADANNEAQVFAAMSGYQNDHRVVYSTNYGKDWSDTAPGLPPFPIQCLVQDPNSGALFAGGQYGVYYTPDPISKPWQLFGKGLPNVLTTALVIAPKSKQMYLATYGRGVWRIALDGL